jgi:hypothetical protein
MGRVRRRRVRRGEEGRGGEIGGRREGRGKGGGSS